MIDDFIRINFVVANDVNININLMYFVCQMYIFPFYEIISVYRTRDFCLFYQIVLLENQNTKPNQRFHVLLQWQHKCCAAEKIQKQNYN